MTASRFTEATVLRAATGNDGLRASIRNEGTDTATLLALVAAGHGLAVLPTPATSGTSGIVAIPVASPRLVHRTELLHGHLATSAATTLAAALQP